MATHLWLTHPAVVYPGSLNLKVSWCWPWLLSIVIWFATAFTWSVVNYYHNICIWSLPMAGCVGTHHISVAWDLVLHLLQKTSSWQSFLRWSCPLQAVQFNCGLHDSTWLLPLGCGWPFVPELLKGPPLDIFDTSDPSVHEQYRMNWPYLSYLYCGLGLRCSKVVHLLVLVLMSVLDSCFVMWLN